MVSIREALESDFVTVEFVKESPSKLLVVYDPGSYERDNYGNERRLTLGVRIDGKEKKWRPNRETTNNLQVLGMDSVDWVGKLIKLRIEYRLGKETVIGKPAEADIATGSAADEVVKTDNILAEQVAGT